MKDKTKVYVLFDTQDNEPVRVSTDPDFDRNMEAFLREKGYWDVGDYMFSEREGRNISGRMALRQGLLKDTADGFKLFELEFQTESKA